MARGGEANWRLYERAHAILDGRAYGHALPILRVLAARGFTPAMNHLAGFESPSRALALHKQAAATDDAMSLQNLATEYLNRGQMARYRHWLARAALQDEDARGELRAFKTRFPHRDMRRLRRLCPPDRG
ncbi:hypothetical protein FHS95_001242 [Sphingomonas naasensis]|uniref:Uncharacterized protein n=1 Tax=Sphingomonas naasensis TaxID=1344951 RepID=A0A4S1W8S2_9SPHN|nr:hypothetical protein [Sphingomonas naasensis]NIJ19573.1 hypothetical protein [Sphingomonas naasensis]TGX39304.1 hypothetical protein E5A74_17475 [Sphingomonas naasensis]